MERVLKFRDNQHEEDRVTKLHGGSNSQTDSGIEQNENNDDDSDASDDDQTDEKKNRHLLAKKAAKRRRRRQAKKKTKTPSSTTKTEENTDADDKANVQIEYVQEDLPVKLGDGYYKHFIEVFENFKLETNGDANGDLANLRNGKGPGGKGMLPRDKTNLDDDIDDQSDDEDSKAAIQSDKKKKDANDDDEQNKKKSKKQLKRETRFSVAQLKQLVHRPDVVEIFDVTAKDPKLLVHLKVIFIFPSTTSLIISL